MIVDERPAAVSAPRAASDPWRTPLLTLFWVASLFLAGFGAKVWLIARFGSPLPFWDHWEEALSTYIPYLDGHLSLAYLFRAHNETRPFFTRVYGLALLLLNGQWDAQLEMVINAAVHAMTMAAFGWLVARQVGTWCWPLLWLPLAAVVALPFAWENTLAGLHSQFYFMLAFSLPTLWLLSQKPPWSRWWCVGAITGLCALFNVASGFIASTAVFCLLALKIFKRRETWKQHLPTLVVCGCLTLAGVLVKANVPHHQALKAHSVADFIVSLGKNLAWPWIVLPAVAVVNWLPALMLGWHYLRSDSVDLPAEDLTLVTGGWTLISGAAAAFARGADGAHPQWRYMDFSSFALVANAMAILVLWNRYRGRGWLGRIETIVWLGWAVMNIAGLWLLTSRAWALDIPERAFYHRAQLRGVRAYMATGDIKYLSAKDGPEQALYYKPGTGVADPKTAAPRNLAAILGHPGLHERLPACVRDPLKVVPDVPTTFVTNGWNLIKPDPPTELSWGSYTAEGVAATGTFTSQPVSASHLPFLEIEVAGDLGKPGLSLELVDVASNKRVEVRPSKPPGGKWQRCQVKAPAGPFRIIARDQSTSGWFAFREPREVGWLSWLTFKTLFWGSFIFLSGICLYAVAIAFWVRRASMGVAASTDQGIAA